VSEGPSGNSTGDPSAHNADDAAKDRVLLDVVGYAVARLLLVVVLTGAIYLAARLLGVSEFPIAVAALFGLIIAMPLGIWLFGRQRRRATAALAIAGERRRAERDQLQARLRGEAVDGEPGADGDEESGS
jgi:hypothetical protein